MNSILRYLTTNWQRLELERYGLLNGQLSCLMVTPRFRASNHVVFLVLSKERSEPLLVAKVPRLTGDGSALLREAAALQALHNQRPGGFETAPRLIALDECWDRPILLETGLWGQPMDPPTIRRDVTGCSRAVIAWLIEIYRETRIDARIQPDWFQQLVERPLQSLSLATGDGDLVEATQRVVAPLRTIPSSLVFTHGDLSHPNILIRQGGRLGVLDWENAEPRGLPMGDLFFFLTYATFALSRTRSKGDHLDAFEAAFWGPEAWALAYVRQFARAIDLEGELLTPLFVLTWVRYLARLVERLQVEIGSDISTATKNWLLNNRYYALWRQSVLQHAALPWQCSNWVEAT